MIVQGDQIQPIKGLEHRSGSYFSRTVVRGKPGTPGNFKFSLNENGTDHYGPRHRHNFDQFRFMFEGDSDFKRDGALKSGMIGYYPEGVPYGPQTNTTPTRMAIVQFGGASANGYLQASEVRAGMEELKEFGEFKDGVFRRHAGVEGKRNMDAYQAIWEHVTKRKMEYPKSRYTAPILMDPANFDWIAVDGAPGVFEKVCGIFTEFRVEAGFLKIEAGASHTVRGRGLFLVLSGHGSVAGEELRKDTTVYLEAGEHTTLYATATTDLLHLGLPDFTRLRMSADTTAQRAA